MQEPRENEIGMKNTSNENINNQCDSNRHRVNNRRFVSGDISKIDNPENSNVLFIAMRSVHIIKYALCMQCQQITFCNGLNETFCIRGWAEENVGGKEITPGQKSPLKSQHSQNSVTAEQNVISRYEKATAPIRSYRLFFTDVDRDFGIRRPIGIVR